MTSALGSSKIAPASPRPAAGQPASSRPAPESVTSRAEEIGLKIRTHYSCCGGSCKEASSLLPMAFKVEGEGASDNVEEYIVVKGNEAEYVKKQGNQIFERSNIPISQPHCLDKCLHSYSQFNCCPSDSRDSQASGENIIILYCVWIMGSIVSKCRADVKTQREIWAAINLYNTEIHTAEQSAPAQQTMGEVVDAEVIGYAHLQQNSEQNPELT